MAIIYNDTVQNFKKDVVYNEIVSKLKDIFIKYGISGGSTSEMYAWSNSAQVLY